MNGHTNPVPMMLPVPTAMQATQAVNSAHCIFARTLACWASDVLQLRRSGGDCLTWSAHPRRSLRQAA